MKPGYVLGSRLAALALCLTAAIGKAQTTPPEPTAQELAQRVENLERQVVVLRNQLAAVQPESRSPVLPAPTEQVVAQPGTVQPSTVPTSSFANLFGNTGLSAILDTYYSYNVNHPDSRTNGLRSFDTTSSQFAMNLVKLQVDKTPDPSNSRTGYRVALGFGQAMNAVNGSDPAGLGFDQYLEEAYLSYLAPIGKGLQADVGKFVTPHGAEVIETKDDWNYSRSLLFSYAIPYFHYGMRLKYAFNDRYSMSGFLVNGWNNVMDNNSGKTVGVGFSWNLTKKLSLTQNYMAGPELKNTNADWRHLWDTLLTYTPTRRLALMANYDYGRGDHVLSSSSPVFWTGIAAYARYLFNDRYSLAARYEYYDDHNGFTTGTAQQINEVTGTFQYVLARHIMNRLEYRHDQSSEPTFLKGSGLPANGQDTFTAGLVFTFDSREEQ